MKDFDEILSQLQSDLESDIPGLLTAKSLTDFEEYEIGPSTDPGKVGLYLYIESGSADPNTEYFSCIIQLQLYNIDELAKAKYASVLYDYIKNYDPANIGMVSFEGVEWEGWPIEENSSSFFYLMPTWKEELDSCDED